MDKRIEIIGIDHGWSNMKMATQVFTTGVKEITTEPAFFDNVVEFGGVYYKVGGKRLEVRDCKVENDNFYILTLAALAKELCRRGKKEADVLISTGLPLTRFGAEKQEFISYLSRNKEVTFRFEKKKYKVRIARVSVLCSSIRQDCSIARAGSSGGYWFVDCRHHASHGWQATGAGVRDKPAGADTLHEGNQRGMCQAAGAGTGRICDTAGNGRERQPS